MTACPRCGYPYYCGCSACAPRNPPKVLTFVHTPDGEGESCGNCGFTASCDWWLDYEVACLRQVTKDPFAKVKIE